MKIEKLYTLSQFVDLMEQSTVGQMVAIFGKHYHKFIPITIFKYNKFLKQPLKKEMFVNELEYPDKANYDFTDKNVTYNGKGYPERCYDHDLKAWQEAEKKVIFKGEFMHDDEFGIMIKESDGEYALLIDEDCFLYKRPISVIANMKLELQNVEL